MSDEYKIIDPAEMKVALGDLPHPGEWVRRNVLEPFGLDVSKAARRIKMDRVTLSRVLAGRHAVSRDLAYKLEALTGVDANLMIGLQAAYETAQDRDKRERYAREIERLQPVAGANT